MKRILSAGYRQGTKTAQADKQSEKTKGKELDSIEIAMKCRYKAIALAWPISLKEFKLLIH